MRGGTDDRDRWDRRYRERPDRCGSTYRPVLDLAAPVLPTGGRALDVACGAGHNTVFLARHGLDVVAADVSPVALELVRRHAADAGVADRVTTLQVDLTQGLDDTPELDGPFDAVTLFFYHAPELLPGLVQRVASGGTLVVEVPNVTNLELGHTRPPRPFLWERGQLLDLARGLHVDLWAEGIVGSRSVSRLVARRDPELARLLRLDSSS